MPSETLGVGEHVTRRKTARMSLAADSKSPDTLCWKQAPGEYVQLPATSWDGPPLSNVVRAAALLCQMLCVATLPCQMLCAQRLPPVNCGVCDGSPLSNVVCAATLLCQMLCVGRRSSVKCGVCDGSPLSNVVCVAALLCQMLCVAPPLCQMMCVWRLSSVKCGVRDGSPLSNVVCVATLLCQLLRVGRLFSVKCGVLLSPKDEYVRKTFRSNIYPSQTAKRCTGIPFI